MNFGVTFCHQPYERLQCLTNSFKLLFEKKVSHRMKYLCPKCFPNINEFKIAKPKPKMAIFLQTVPFIWPVINCSRWNGKRFYTADSRKVVGIKHSDITISVKRHCVRFLFRYLVTFVRVWKQGSGHHLNFRRIFNWKSCNSEIEATENDLMSGRCNVLFQVFHVQKFNDLLKPKSKIPINTQTTVQSCRVRLPL